MNFMSVYRLYSVFLYGITGQRYKRYYFPVKNLSRYLSR